MKKIVMLSLVLNFSAFGMEGNGPDKAALRDSMREGYEQRMEALGLQDQPAAAAGELGGSQNQALAQAQAMLTLLAKRVDALEAKQSSLSWSEKLEGATKGVVGVGTACALWTTCALVGMGIGAAYNYCAGKPYLVYPFWH